MNKFILCADGFGKNKDYNRAVLNGCNNGFIRSCSIIANGEAFDAAINDILPECPNLSVGINLNLTEGESIFKDHKLLASSNKFKYSRIQLEKQIKKNNIIIPEIDVELHAQIEKVRKYTKIYHLNSIDNIHIIPEIFDIVNRLAIEYNIKYVRIPNEELYIVPDIKYSLNLKYLKNVFNLLKMRKFSKMYQNILQTKNINYNDYIIGVGYSGLINKKTLEYGLKTICDEDNIIVECAIEPCSYLRNVNNARSIEFKMSQDKILEDTIYRLGFEIVGHKDLLK